MRIRRLALALVALGAITACGTTVPETTQIAAAGGQAAAVNGGDLAGPATSAAAASATGGAPGASAATDCAGDGGSRGEAGKQGHRGGD